MVIEDTLNAPRGGELYAQMTDQHGQAVDLTYNDLWTLLVCRYVMDGDWVRTSRAAVFAPDGDRKQALVHRLWELELNLGTLPEIAPEVQQLHLQRAYAWFKRRNVSDSKNW